LRRELSASSGIAEVKQTLSKYFHQQDHLLKVRSVLEELRRLSYAPGSASAEMSRFRDALEALRLDPEMHPVVELEVLHDCCTGRVTLPEPMLEEITRLFSPGTAGNRLGVAGGDQAALAEAAKQGMARWRTFMVTEANPAQQRVARVVLRSYQLIWKDLQ
jgi:hypothetical protein